MTRFACLVVALAGFTFSGCGGDAPATDADDAETTSSVEDDIKEAGMEGMTNEEYLSGGKKSDK